MCLVGCSCLVRDCIEASRQFNIPVTSSADRVCYRAEAGGALPVAVSVGIGLTIESNLHCPHYRSDMVSRACTTFVSRL